MLTEVQKLQAFTARQPTSQRPAAEKLNHFPLLLRASGHHRGSSRTEINDIFRALLSDSLTAAGYSEKKSRSKGVHERAPAMMPFLDTRTEEALLKC